MSHAWHDFIGKQIRLRKEEETIEGTVAGPSRSFAANDEGENAQPLWRIEVDGGELKTVHPDDWMVEAVEDGDGGAWGTPKR